MAYQTPSDPYVKSFRCDANMTGKEYFLVKRNGGNDMDICGAGELPFGALTEDVQDCSSTAKNLPVQIGRLVAVVCGGGITAGTLAMSDASGEAVTWTTGNYWIGQAVDTYVDGEVGVFIWGPGTD